MDTNTTEQAPVAAPDAAPTTAASPAPTPATAPDTNEPVITPEARLEQLLAAKAEAEKQSAEPEPPAATPEVKDPEPAPATPEPKPEPEPAKEEETPEPQAKEKILPNRISTSQFTPEEQEAIALAKAFRDRGEDVPTFTERLEIVRARHKPAEPAPQPQAVSTPEPDSDLAELDAKLAAMEAEESEEAEALGVKSLRDKQREIQKLERQRDALLQQKQQTAAQAAAQHKAAVNAAIDRAGTMFPDAKDPGSELGQSIAALIKEIRSTPGHPNAAILSTADAAIFLTQTAASKLAAIKAEENGTDYGTEYAKLTASKKAPAAPPKTQVATPQAKKPVLAGASASTPPPVSPPAKPLTRLDLANMSLEELKALRPQSQAFILRT